MQSFWRCLSDGIPNGSRLNTVSHRLNAGPRDLGDTGILKASLSSQPVPAMKKLRIFTWQIHGNYLYYLSHVPHELYVPFTAAIGPAIMPDASTASPGPRRSGTFPLKTCARCELRLHPVPAAEPVPEGPVRDFHAGAARSCRASTWNTTLPRTIPTNMRHHRGRPRRAAGACHSLQPAHVGQRHARRPASSTTALPFLAGVSLYRGTAERPGRRQSSEEARPAARAAMCSKRCGREVPLDLVGMGSEEAGRTGRDRP